MIALGAGEGQGETLAVVAHAVVHKAVLGRGGQRGGADAVGEGDLMGGAYAGEGGRAVALGQGGIAPVVVAVGEGAGSAGLARYGSDALCAAAGAAVGALSAAFGC